MNTTFSNLPTTEEFQGVSGTYRPGGDAQHVSALVRELALDALSNNNSEDVYKIEPGTEIKVDPEMAEAALALLPSQALQNKLRWAIRNIETGQSRVLRRVAAEYGYKFTRANHRGTTPAGDVKGYAETTIKQGRWEYPARKYTDGSIERNTKRDGTGEWVAA